MMPNTPGGGYNLRSKKSRQALNMDSEQEGSTTSSRKNKPSSVKSGQRFQKPSSRVASSSSSFSTALRNAEIDHDSKTKLHQLSKEETTLKTQWIVLKKTIDKFKGGLDELNKCMQSPTTSSNREDTYREMSRIKALLFDKELEREVFEMTMNDRLAEIAKERELVLEKTSLEKNKILELNEQNLGSDDDGSEHDNSVLPKTISSHTDRVQTYVEDATVETERQRQEAELAARLLEERVQLEAQLKVQTELADQAMEKARLELVNREEEEKKAALAAKRRQEELNHQAAVATQTKIEVEAKLKALGKTEKKTNSENSTTAPPAGTEVVYLDKMMRGLTEALIEVVKSNNNAASNKAIDNNAKMMARNAASKDLPLFDGKAEDWPLFFADFNRTTEECDFDNSQNLNRLRKCLKGEAHEYVKSMMLAPENVPQIIKDLKERFGQPEIIIRAMINKAKQVPPVEAEKMEGLVRFGSAVRNFTATVKSLNRPEHLCNPELLHQLESKLPDSLRMIWSRWVLDDSTRKRDLEHFSKWLSREMTVACQFIPPVSQDIKPVDKPTVAKKVIPNQDKRVSFNSEKQKKAEDFPTAAGLFNSNPVELDCIFCKKHKNSADCRTAQTWILVKRQSIAKENSCCLRCLQKGHWAKDCQVFLNCFLCGQRHVQLMCPEFKQVIRSSPKAQQQQHRENPKPLTDGVQITNNNLACSSNTLLPTVMVKIAAEEGYRYVRALIDTGSERSYILKSLVEELKLLHTGEETIINSLFGGLQTPLTRCKQYWLQLWATNKDQNDAHYIEALESVKICSPLSKVTKGPWMKDLRRRGIWLSDYGPNPTQIGLLIGSDGVKNLFTGRIEELENGLTAVETVLGWTLMGKQELENHYPALNVQSLTVMDVPLSNLWDLEALGIQDPSEQKSKAEKEELAKRHFAETVTRTDEGRYVVSLPWIQGKPKIPNNRAIAEKRLESTTKSLISKGMFNTYNQLFKQWEDHSFIEEVPESEVNNTAHYIPHRAVLKPESLTTPVRPVFDASCKAVRTPSLNECMEKGPNLVELIPSILLRFREQKIGIISDIGKAFQQIDVAREDQDYLRFLWWENEPLKKHKIFRHRRVVFGVNCSPFLLAAVLERHLTDVEHEDVVIAEKLRKSLYVDNCVTSEDTWEEAHKFKDWSTNKLAEAKMDLRCWEFGSVEGSGVGLLTNSECGLDSGGTNSAVDERIVTLVLGYKWNKDEDTIYCNIPSRELPTRINKRMILSALQQVFDPIGFTCPATLPPKLLLQRLWIDKVSWDADIPEDLKEEFLTWSRQLPDLLRIAIPRNMNAGITSRKDWQLHTFSDGSMLAYSAVVFLRATDEYGNASIQLLQAKSRVAPLKKITINRLELMGCYIATLLANAVVEALNIEDIPVYFWTDSSTALAWIRGNDDWGTFVGNRVRKICQFSKVEQWRHVPGILNPADLPSRGCMPTQLVKLKWYEGPDWLKRPETEWPKSNAEPDEDEVAQERKKTVTCLLLAKENPILNPWYATRSNYSKNVRNMAWLVRFIRVAVMKECTSDLISMNITVDEYDLAEKVIVRLLQADVFQSNQTTISGIPVSVKEDGVIRVHTKISNRVDFEGLLFPALLPNQHPVVEQLIREEHLRNKHAGVQFLMGRLREKFWIVQGRKAIREITNGCLACRRQTVRHNQMMSPPLPLDRVQTAKAFEITGVDLAGPLYPKDGSKAWIVLFTCAIYRCIHLEVVQSLSTDGFLDAFTCFTSRRGRPDIVYSDNGTNFKGADNLFRLLDWNDIVKRFAMQRIVWKFNPPSAPWWGGWWERLVGSVKGLLRRSLQSSKIEIEKLRSIMCEIESVINNRPLTFVTEDPEDFRPLTPAMFLHELPCPGISDQTLLEASGFQKLFSKRMNVLELMKTRFRTEYFALLINKGKQLKSDRELRVGEIVLIGDDNKKRWEWPMGRILKTMPGKDGRVRVAEVKTAGGIFIRPIQRLYPMEISSAADIPVDPNESFEVPEEEDEEKLESHDLESPENKRTQQDLETVTRSGRKVRAPNRYAPN